MMRSFFPGLRGRGSALGVVRETVFVSVLMVTVSFMQDQTIDKEPSVCIQDVSGVTCGAWEPIEKQMCRRSPAGGHLGDWYGGGTIWLCDPHAERAADGMIDAAGDIVVAAVAVIDGDGPLMSDAALAEYAAANPEPPPLEPRAPRIPQVYVIERGRWVKIGKSVDVPSRLKVLKNGGSTMPDGMVIGPFNLLFTIPHDCETELHQRFSVYRDRGEWFRHEGEVAEWTAGMRRNAQAPFKLETP
ncbi:MAG: GIY-YIG nuclease family protein [Nocardioides sp.]|uniref:GIY-YIG nuclease family protein n=1 Tax=Nocardioides sp. TaxID=35761 RepID=UPI0039E467B5